REAIHLARALCLALSAAPEARRARIAERFGRALLLEEAAGIGYLRAFEELIARRIVEHSQQTVRLTELGDARVELRLVEDDPILEVRGLNLGEGLAELHRQRVHAIGHLPS